jgi:predicted glycosyltransferase
MNLLFDIGHPGQVHLFKYVIRALIAKGHKVTTTTKEIPEIKELLNAYHIPYESLGAKFDSIMLKGISHIKFNINLYNIAKREKIDIAIGSSMTIAHASVFHRLKAIVLDDDDSEAVRLFSKFAHPFADCILSPNALSHQRNGSKDLTYAGTHELFYLHPQYFNPDQKVLNEAGVAKGDPFFIVRFVFGKAYHDKGKRWMTFTQKMKIIETLEQHGRVFITTEREIDGEFRKWQLKLKPERIHHLMYYANMFVGDSQTMTSEAAILGTPALKCNSFAHCLSIPNLLEDKYGLCYSYLPTEFEKMILKMELLLRNHNLKNDWRKKRLKFLEDNINPTLFLVWFIENYPESFRQMKDKTDYQYTFK